MLTDYCTSYVFTTFAFVENANAKMQPLSPCLIKKKNI